MTTASKHDGGKIRWDFLPPLPLEQLAQLYTLGAAKYGDHNWTRGFDYARMYAAMMRHLQAWWMGEDYDQEDGQHHLTAVAWYCFGVIHYEMVGPKQDNRPFRRESQGDVPPPA